jgi:hypothetical protein
MRFCGVLHPVNIAAMASVRYNSLFIFGLFYVSAKVVINVVKTNLRCHLLDDLFCRSCCGVCRIGKLIDLISDDFSADLICKMFG